MADRAARKSGAAHPADDLRSAFQRDRDRILYAPAFRRLAGVTQVASASEGHIFHNRLTHSLEVAQIARRLCERLLLDFADQSLAAGLDSNSPEICEAAALAHDLGHPPFGHVAEKALRKLADGYVAGTGFEGNAQSFRILTQLSPRKRGPAGLDLTQATLNATLKYPWLRGSGPSKEKWGAYPSEREDFEFARAGDNSTAQSAEAAIMDLADDIAYSTHDLIDFFRAGLIPPLVELDFVREIEGLKKNDKVKIESALVDDHVKDIKDLRSLIAGRRFGGTWEESAGLSSSTSDLIAAFTSAVSVSATGGKGVVQMANHARVRIAFLKHLVWTYVIWNPRLATQQAGQRRIIEDLFRVYTDALTTGNTDLLPREFDRWYGPPRTKMDKTSAVRVCVDVIASFTDHQAWLVHRRVTGAAPGSLAESVYV